jgi:hypothetical protein
MVGFFVLCYTLNMTEQGKTAMRAEFTDEGLRVDFVPPKDTSDERVPHGQAEPVDRGFDLGLSEEAKKDPTFQVMAAECALWGLSDHARGHTWGD